MHSDILKEYHQNRTGSEFFPWPTVQKNCSRNWQIYRLLSGGFNNFILKKKNDQKYHSISQPGKNPGLGSFFWIRVRPLARVTAVVLANRRARVARSAFG